MKPAKEIPARITVHVPLSFVTRGGRKAIFVPVADAPSPSQAKHNTALIKSLARAYRWRRLIEDGEYASITELADAKGVNQSYACRLLRLTLLSPAIVEAALSERQPADMNLASLMQPLPITWAEQQTRLSTQAIGA